MKQEKGRQKKKFRLEDWEYGDELGGERERERAIFLGRSVKRSLGL